MTNYNERLDEILDYYADEHRNHAYEFDNKEMSQNEYLKSMRSDKGKAKQALTSLNKELVAEAKPEIKAHPLGPVTLADCQRGLDHYEANLLKALEEV